MIHFLRSTLHPEQYHGHNKKGPFFEGWYYKLVDASEAHRYAIIPGVFLGTDSGARHAFVQVLDGMTGRDTYHTYLMEDFRAAEGKLDLQIGPNRFAPNHITLDIAGPERTVLGELTFTGLSPWPVTWFAPGIMGWYAWMPFMECYHGVVSLDHGIHGALTIDGQAIEFTGGRGYIEKDWGQRFPSAWVWYQSNHFTEPGTSLTASIAIIPWIGRSFRGFIIGLWHGRHLYRFATYTGAITEKMKITDAEVTWVVRDRRFRLEMLATRAAGGLLHGPTHTEMQRRVAESLSATVQVRLCDLTGRAPRPVFEGTGRNAGLEVNGDLAALIAYS